MGSRNEVRVLLRRLHDLVKRWYLTRTRVRASNDGARSLHSDIQSRHAIEYHFPLLCHARRSTSRRDFFGPVRLSLCVSSSPCSLYTSPLQKLLCGGEERRRPNCVFRFTLARRCSAAGGEEGLGRQKRREIKTKWNVLLSSGYPFHSYHTLSSDPTPIGRPAWPRNWPSGPGSAPVATDSADD